MNLFFRLSFALLITCAIGCGNYPVKMSHGPLPQSSSQRSGKIEIAPFKDTRNVPNKAAIGDAKGGFGNRLGDFVVKDGRPIEAVVQAYLEEALRHVGYETLAGPGAKVRFEGEVFEFWMD